MKSKTFEAFYESLFDNLADGLTYCQMIFDKQGNPVDFVYLRVNKNFEKLTGLKEVEGKRITEAVPGISESNPELFKIYGQVALTGQPNKFEVYVEPLSRWFFVSAYSPQKNFFIAVFQNITKQKEIEKNLENARIAAQNVLEDLSAEKSKAEIEVVKDEAIFSSIGDGLIVTDSEGNIVQVNEAFEKLLGWSAEEVIGKKMLDIVQKVDENGKIIPPGQRSLHRVLTGEIPAGKISTVLKTHSYIRKDKSQLPITGIVTPMMLNNKIVGAVQIFRDVTHEREVDKTKTEFVSLASHQLRTPLTTISWNAEMLLGGDAGRLKPEQAQCLEVIYHSNQRMIDLVNALLNVSRLELGTFTAELKLVDITKIADQVIADLSHKMHKKKQTFEKKYDKNFKPMMLDEKIISIVLQNLLSNALKYTPEKGKIMLEIKIEDEALKISVADNGIGIPVAQQDKLFTKLFRADNARVIDTEGTGLGLYLVKLIMDHSGGKVWFESTENKGSTFYATLPLAGMKEQKDTRVLT